MAPKRVLDIRPNATYLSARGYGLDITDANTQLIAELREALTVKPRVNPSMPNSNEVKPFPVYRESTHKFYVPRAFGLERFGPPTVDRLHDGADAPNLAFAGLLRPEQEAPVSAFLGSARDRSRGGGIINLGCAAGKTVTSLYIACALQKKTLVICHKDFLMNQWRERIEQFVPTARVGIIKQAKVQTDDKDIVLASLQSLAMREYHADMLSTFGLCIIDECHRVAAEVFSRALPKVTARVMMGLSATLDRKDGLRKVIEMFLGPPVFSKKREDTQMRVRMVKYYDENPAYSRERLMFNGKRNIAQMVTALTEFKPRNEVILQELQTIFDTEPERQIMILSDRRMHLKLLAREIEQRFQRTVGFYVGGMKQADLDISATKNVVLATNSMASEALDIPSLNTLFLVTPLSTVEQQVGRIQRQKPSERKYIPLTVDIWDDFSIFKTQGIRRIQFYKKNGYEVVHNTHLEDCKSSDEEEAKPAKLPQFESESESESESA